MQSNHSIKIKGRLIDLSVPKVMGIINATPDSFYAGSRVENVDELVKKAEEMLSEGADFLDIGGYSSRPGADDISTEEEIERVCPAISQIIAANPEAIISIDTFRSKVAGKALDAGATIVNDISGGHLDKEMLPMVAECKVPYIAMHMRGTPQTMMELTDYSDLLGEITRYFLDINEQCKNLGIHDLILDPGFGFAKTLDQNFQLLKHLDQLRHLGRPLLVGLSRKSMIYKSLKSTADASLNGTTSLNSIALFKGASILRVHDIREAKEVVQLVSRLS